MQGRKILAISGSLKAVSSNSQILKAIANLVPAGVEFLIYDRLGDLPHFNPDIDKEPFPEAVKHFREQVTSADGILISTPEYAFGAPGVLKNALDWTVSTTGINRKPVALISASPMYGGGDKAHASIMLTLKALDAIVDEKSKLMIPAVYKKIDPATGKIIDPETGSALSTVMQSLLHTIETNLISSPS